jgi:5S rRNA maturation endonuclease (ribonuclease M5)
VTVEEFLARLEHVKKNSSGWIARCPAHDDRTPSLSVGAGDDGRILVKCQAGCDTADVVAQLGLTFQDLSDSRSNTQSYVGSIVAEYDYVDEQGALLYQAVRFEPKRFLQRRPDGRGGWVWKLDKTRRVLYRLPRVLEGVAAGETIYVAEGEKDVYALEQAGAVATCNPMGAGKWRDSYSKVLRGAAVIVVQDRDEEGHKHAAKVAESLRAVAANVRIVEAAEGKDAADHLAAGHTLDDFRPRPQPDDPDTRTNTREPASLSGSNVREPTRTTPGQPPPLAYERDILDRFRRDLRLAGVAGEETLAQIVYLAVTSRVLPWGKSTERPVSVIPKGSTSTGKSHATRTTLWFFPPSAWLDLGSMSRKYLFYSDESYEHRFIYVPEWASIKEDEELVALLRVLLSEGRVVHGTVDVERKAQLIEKAGPTGLIMTTTEAAVDSEMETRCLTVTTDDSTEQTRRVYGVFADLEDELESPVDFAAWHELQDWIGGQGAASRAAVPFVRALAELMPVGATRLRRDFVTLLCLVRAHAILHQLTREKDARGRVIATLDDYEAVASLVGDVIAEGVEASVSSAMRSTVEAVQALQDEGAEYVSPRALTERLGVGRSATYDRIRRALLRGYLANEAAKDERGMKLIVGAALPGADDFLPSAADIVRVSSGTPPGQSFGSTMRGEAASSGSPGCPDGPPDNTPCQHLSEWLARDGVWRCKRCEPPMFPAEVLEERAA